MDSVTKIHMGRSLNMHLGRSGIGSVWYKFEELPRWSMVDSQVVVCNLAAH